MLEDYAGLALVFISVIIAGALCFGFGYLHGRRSAMQEVIIDRYYQGRLGFEPDVPPEPEVEWAEDEMYRRLAEKRKRREGL